MSSKVVVLLLAAAPVLADSPLPIDDGERIPVMTTVPEYPKEAVFDRIEGQVEVCFNVDREGRPMRIAVRSSTHRIFEKPSMQAVRESSYEPLHDGVALSGIKTCRTFRFFLDPVAIEDPTAVDDLVDSEAVGESR